MLSALLDPLSTCNNRRHHNLATNTVILSAETASCQWILIHTFRNNNPSHRSLRILQLTLFLP